MFYFCWLFLRRYLVTTTLLSKSTNQARKFCLFSKGTQYPGSDLFVSIKPLQNVKYVSSPYKYSQISFSGISPLQMGRGNITYFYLNVPLRYLKIFPAWTLFSLSFLSPECRSSRKRNGILREKQVSKNFWIRMKPW